MISFFLFLLSFLLETYIWKVCINKHLRRRELTFLKSLIIVNASGILKYLPGRIWTYMAQLLWLKKYNIPNTVILYVNVICLLGALAVSAYLGLIYVAVYTTLMSRNVIIVSFVALILFNAAYITWNSLLINTLVRIVGRLLKKEIKPLNDSKLLILFIQFIYACSWSLTGLSGYFLAKGIGLTILFNDIFAILASMSLSWVVGYVSIITPGGLGIREGMMLLMLNNIVSIQTALIFPILSRILYLIAEAVLGLMALLCGIKYKVFSSEKACSE